MTTSLRGVTNTAPTGSRRASLPGRRPRSRTVPRVTGAPRTRRWWRIGLIAVAVIVTATVGFGLAVWSRIDRRHLTLPGSAGGTTYLIVGSDSRAFVQSASDRARFGSSTNVVGERADVLLVVRRVGSTTTVMNIPRDLVVISAQGAPTRITMSLSAGLQSLVDVTCHSLGIGVDHVALVHFDGLRDAIDAVGGIDVAVPTPIRDTTTGLDIRRAGTSRLDGQQALALVRSRTGERLVNNKWEPEPPSASERGGRAATVLRALGARAPVSLTTPIVDAEKLWAFAGAVTVDDGLGPSGLRALASILQSLHTATRADLPVAFHPGVVPEALARPAAVTMLRHFQQPSANCTPRLPTLRSGG